MRAENISGRVQLPGTCKLNLREAEQGICGQKAF